MDRKRIQQAENYIHECEADNRIHRCVVEQIVIDTYNKNQQESLELAQELLEANKSVLWTVVTSYYAMFYAANRLLAQKGIKISGQSRHKTTVEALIVFARNDIQEELINEYEDAVAQALDLIESFDYERKKRGTIQYQTTQRIQQAQAKTSYERAIHFITILHRLS